MNMSLYINTNDIYIWVTDQLWEYRICKGAVIGPPPKKKYCILQGSSQIMNDLALFTEFSRLPICIYIYIKTYTHIFKHIMQWMWGEEYNGGLFEHEPRFHRCAWECWGSYAVALWIHIWSVWVLYPVYPSAIVEYVQNVVVHMIISHTNIFVKLTVCYSVVVSYML